MRCIQARRLLSPMMDSALEAREANALSGHLDECEACSAQWAAMRRTRWMMSTLAPHSAPPELSLRLKGAIFEQLSATRQSRWDAMLRRFESTLNANLFAATGGLISAMLIFGILLGFLMPPPPSNATDVPTMLYTPPEMTAAPFGLGSGASEDSLLVEAVIDTHGRVQDYRLLNPTAESALTPEMKNALIFAQFRPATSFGQPTSGRVVISFSHINVGG